MGRDLAQTLRLGKIPNLEEVGPEKRFSGGKQGGRKESEGVAPGIKGQASQESQAVGGSASTRRTMKMCGKVCGYLQALCWKYSWMCQFPQTPTLFSHKIVSGLSELEAVRH